MHENIKFTICLSSETVGIAENEIALVRTYPMKDPTVGSRYTPVDRAIKQKIGDWQPIYSDVDYGTDHTIFAKFIGTTGHQEVDDPSEKDSKRKRKIPGFLIHEIQLYLQCWKGPVSLGFNHQKALIEAPMRREPDDEDGDTRFPERDEHNIIIGLEGLKSSLSDNFMVDPTKFYLENKKGYEHLSEKNALFIKSGDTLVVNTWFSPARPCFSKIFETPSEIKNSPFVDQKFMKRLGDDIGVTAKGYLELERIRDEYEMITQDQLDAAHANRIERIDKMTLKQSDGRAFPRPCEDRNSRFVII